jgi:hypothetical protein
MDCGTMAGRRIVVTGFRNKVAALSAGISRRLTAELVRGIQMRRFDPGDGG